MSNNEQIDKPPIITEDTSEAGASVAGGSAGAAVATASGGDRERFPSPIVSIAAGLMNEGTTTTTSTKTTPTPYSKEQLHTMMPHAAETQSKLKQNQQEIKLTSTPLSSTSTLDDYNSSPNVVNQSAPVQSLVAAPFIFGATNTSSISVAAPTTAVHNFQLSPPLPTHAGSGATAKGKTQDDQNVGKRQKKKKTKYDSWEDSDFNGLDDASLKKLLEEAYWYRNPGDRKNKSERFLQMLKKAEYDEENSYRAIKTCITRNTNSSSTAATSSSFGSSNSAAGSFSYHTNHRSSGSHRHKQGGSLQDLVEATHRSELANTSSQAVVAAAAAEAVANQRFNCDYQLSGGRNSMNRRQQQQHNNSNQHSSSNNASSSASKRINKNSSVSTRQREGGSLPSSVNQFESATVMDTAKLKHIGSGGEVTPTTSTSAGTGSCLSLPETEAATQFDMDDVATMDTAVSGTSANTQQDDFINRWDISSDGKLWNIANGSDLQTLEKVREIRKVKKVNPTSGGSFNTHSMTILGAKILEGLQQQQQQQKQQMHSFTETKDASTVKEFLIDDALQFSVLELSAKNQQLQQQYPAVPANVSGGAAGVPYPQTMDEQKRRLDAGYVSLNDNYTACSSVYGVGGAVFTDGDGNGKTGSGGAVSSSLSSSSTSTTTVNGGGCNAGGVAKGVTDGFAPTDMRPSKIGRMVSAVATAAASSQAAKSGVRQFDENGNAVSDGYGNNGGPGNAGLCASASTNGNSNQFTALITTTVGGVGGTPAAAISGSIAGSTSGPHVAPASSQRQNSVSTSTTTTAMTAAAVAASINSQLGAGPPQSTCTTSISATNTTITTTKLKSKKKSQQERNTIEYFVDEKSVAGCRGADPVEQLLKYIENDEKNNSAGQKKKERKKQSKLKKSNSLEELRSCSKMEVDDLNKYQAATTEMMRQKKGGCGATTSSGTSTKHNSASAADINKNCNKEQVQQQQAQHQPVSSAVQVRGQPRKGERRSWGTEELQYLGDQQQKEQQQNQLDWQTAASPKTSAQELPLEFPALAGMSEMDALNTVLSETAEFHVVTKKKKPKKQRAVTMDDATVAAANTGGNLQRMQPITKSASSNMMSQRVQQHYGNYYNQQPPHVKMERQFVEKQQSSSSQPAGSAHVNVHGQGQTTTTTTTTATGNSSLQDSSRRKSTSSMPPSEKSDSSDLDSVHSLPIQTGKKKSSRVNSSSSSVTSVQGGSHRQAKPNNNSYNSPPAAISYADIARKRLEAALNSSTSNAESPPAEIFNSGKLSTKQTKSKPDFPELPGATTSVISTAVSLGSSVVASIALSASISYSQSLNAMPASSSSDVDVASPEILPATISSISSSSTSSSSSPPALQKSKSVENEASYSFNSTNLDQQYPALEMTVKRHSTSNVAMASSSTTNANTSSSNSNNSSTTVSSSSSYNFAAAAKQQVADKSTSAKLKAKPKEKTTINHSKPSQEDTSSVILSASSSASSSTSTSTSMLCTSPSSSSTCSPVAATLKTTAATQTDRTKKISGKSGGVGGGAGASGVGLVAASSSSMTTNSAGVGRPAVIILNDDKDATHNEFIFGDFNEDELKMLNDHENVEASPRLNQENNNKNKVDNEEEDHEVQIKEHLTKSKESTDFGSDQLILNDSGAVSDMVSMSSTLDMLSISGEALQSSPNAAAGITNASTVSMNNSSTLSSTSSNSSSSASIFSSASAGGGGGASRSMGGSGGSVTSGGGISSLANQSNDSGIIANTSVNNFISKATSSDVLVSKQQLETCNDIEAAIIAAARAAAAVAKRSSSCSRSNSQEPEFVVPTTAEGAGSAASAKVLNKSSSSTLSSSKTTLPVYMACQDGDDDDETLHELSFMPDLNKAEIATPPTLLANNESLAPTTRQTAVMTNTDLIVDYIASTWNAIVKSKYVTFYSEEPEPES